MSLLFLHFVPNPEIFSVHAASPAGVLLHVDLGEGQRRLGGSALAQAYSQLGDQSPDIRPATLRAMWEVVQGLIDRGVVASGHDISDGGIATTLLEMAFAGARLQE